MVGGIVFFVNQWIRFVRMLETTLYSCVNNILERDNQEEIPVKWGKKLKIFP